MLTIEKTSYGDPQEAFRDAIHNSGELSDDPSAANWAGHYMYMGTERRGRVEFDLFKHRDTRQYLRVRYDICEVSVT